MKVLAVVLNEEKTEIHVLGVNGLYRFPINDDLTLETSLDEENMILTVNLSGVEFKLTVDTLKLRMFNQVLAAYNRLKKSRLEPAPNWKDEFKKLGYVPCY